MQNRKKQDELAKKLKKEWLGKPYPTWFNDKGTILDVLPYYGLYQDIFACIFRISDPKTLRGYTEMSVSRIDLKRMKI